MSIEKESNDSATLTAASLAEMASRAHYALYDAHIALQSIPPLHTLAVRTRRELDIANLVLAKAKWYAGRFTGTHLYFAEHTQSTQDAAHAADMYHAAEVIARNCQFALEHSEDGAENGLAAAWADRVRLTSNETEIVFADDVPIVPSVCPIVILKGSPYEMGRQYIQQVTDIFGEWIFQQIAGRQFNQREIAVIDEWRGHLERFTPEIVQLTTGWIDELASLGIELSEHSAMQLWTGHFEPIPDGVRGHGVRELVKGADDDVTERADAAYLGGPSADATLIDPAVDLCSGCCAWGEATEDGGLIAGSTTDHDCTFQVTIVAYPARGNAFVYTPFSVNGFIPSLGQYFFAGHPGMNDKGVAYVHHGGGLHGIEQGEDRGYGLRRGASVIHNLWHADSASSALANELNWPIGDVGTILGSVGGFYADGASAYVCEARPSGTIGEDPIIREKSYDESGKSYEFLYANNNSMHPRSSHGFDAPPQGYQFNPVEGWIADRPAEMAHLGEHHFATALSTKSSQGRNRYFFDSLLSAYGNIDLQTMLRIVSTPAPERLRGDGSVMSHAEREAAWVHGAPWPSSISHRLNAFTAVMQPSANGDGLYMGCIGPANFRSRMHTPGHGYFRYQEANEFWEIRLRDSAEDLVCSALVRAEELYEQARTVLDAAVDRTSDSSADHSRLRDLLGEAEDALSKGRGFLADEEHGVNGDVRRLARALRRFTTCQVRAKQVITEATFAESDVALGAGQPEAMSQA